MIKKGSISRKYVTLIKKPITEWRLGRQDLPFGYKLLILSHKKMKRIPQNSFHLLGLVDDVRTFLIEAFVSNLDISFD